MPEYTRMDTTEGATTKLALLSFKTETSAELVLCLKLVLCLLQEFIKYTY